MRGHFGGDVAGDWRHFDAGSASRFCESGPQDQEAPAVGARREAIQFFEEFEADHAHRAPETGGDFEAVDPSLVDGGECPSGTGPPG